jgi:hypothetical protein
MIRWLGILLGAALAGAAVALVWPHYASAPTRPAPSVSAAPTTWPPVPAPPPTDRWRVRWGTVPDLIRITAPASTTLGREERILTCAIPDVQRAWLASGRPPVYLSVGHASWGSWDGPYYFVPASGVGVPAALTMGSDGNLPLTPAVLTVGCPYEHAAWWGRPVPAPSR